MIIVTTVRLSDAEHINHRRAKTPGEAVEQLEQNRILCRPDNGAVKSGVSVDMAFNLGSVLRSRCESLMGSPNIRRRMTLSRKRSGPGFNRDASLDYSQNVGASKDGIPVFRHIQCSNEYPGPLTGCEYFTSGKLTGCRTNGGAADTKLGRESCFTRQFGPEFPHSESNVFEE
jgi:hypothetical protein